MAEIGNRKERMPIFREMPFAFQNRNEPKKQRHTLYREAIKKREIQKISGSWQELGGLEPCARCAGFGMAEIARNACLFFVNRNLHFKPE